jgi:hypothetical protein
MCRSYCLSVFLPCPSGRRQKPRKYWPRLNGVNGGRCYKSDPWTLTLWRSSKKSDCFFLPAVRRNIHKRLDCLSMPRLFTALGDSWELLLGWWLGFRHRQRELTSPTSRVTPVLAIWVLTSGRPKARLLGPSGRWIPSSVYPLPKSASPESVFGLIERRPAVSAFGKN